MKKNIYEKIDYMIGKEVTTSECYETYEDFIIDYIVYFCFYSNEDFIKNIINRLQTILEKGYK